MDVLFAEIDKSLAGGRRAWWTSARPPRAPRGSRRSRRRTPASSRPSGSPRWRPQRPPRRRSTSGTELPMAGKQRHHAEVLGRGRVAHRRPPLHAGVAASPARGALHGGRCVPAPLDASTTRGSNWVPAQRRSSSSASRGRHRALVGAVGDHGVVGVADGHDAGAERDVLARQPVGVALAVPALVAGAHEPCHRRSAGAALRIRSPIDVWRRMNAHSSSSSGPGLSRIASGIAILPTSCSSAAPRAPRRAPRRRCPARRPPPTAQLGHAVAGARAARARARAAC